jgi:hypothetical protein
MAHGSMFENVVVSLISVEEVEGFVVVRVICEVRVDGSELEVVDEFSQIVRLGCL